MARRVLLATMNVGGGHTALRDSFATALQTIDPEQRRYEGVCWDSSDEFTAKLYAFVIHRAPWLQQPIYDASNTRWGMRLAASSPGMQEEARQALVDLKPDVIMSSHLMLSTMFAQAKRQLRLATPVVTAVPDYGEPTSGFFPMQEDLRGDYVVVMDRKPQLHYLYDRRLPSWQVHYSGFLTRPPFAQVAAQLRGPHLSIEQRQVLISQLATQYPEIRRVDLHKPTVLFVGGSAWTEKTEPLMDELLAEPWTLQKMNAIVVCGKNELFHAKLQQKLNRQNRFVVLGQVKPDVMAQLMGLSDVPLLGSLAPATMQELLDTRCGPLLLFHYIRGTELAHIPYIEDNDLGLYEPSPRRMLELLKQATGLAPAGERIAKLLTTFAPRAAEIRRANVERALKLADFLDTTLPGAQAEHQSPERAHLMAS